MDRWSDGRPDRITHTRMDKVISIVPLCLRRVTIIKGQNSVNNVRGVKVCVLCILFVDALYLYNFMKIFFTVFKL